MKRLFVLLAFLLSAAWAHAQQTSESTDLFNKGYEYFINGDKESMKMAVELMNQVIDMPSTDPDLRQKAKTIVDKCNEVIGKVVVKVSASNLNFAADGDFQELNVSVKGAWSVSSSSDWLKVEEKSRNYLKLWCEANPRSVSRSCTLTITSSGESTDIHVHQDPGKEKKGRVYFKTKPHNAYLESSDGSSGYSSSPLVFTPGEYTIRISKEGYESLDTVVSVLEAGDSTRVIDVALKPLFGKLEPVVLAEDGSPVEDVDFRIGRAAVNITDYTNSHSFDDKETIQYYGFYKEGVIPLNPGKYEVTVSADGYRTEVLPVEINSGETTKLEVNLKYIMGRLLVRDGRNAEGATVFIPDLRMKAAVGDTLDVPVGEYQVEIRKKNYELLGDALEAKVDKGRLTVLNARMTRLVPMYVSTEGGGERVFVNDVLMNYQEPEHRFSLTEGEEYKVDVKKDGYWHFVRDFKVSKKDTLFDFRNLQLQTVDTLMIDSDEPDVKIVLKKKDGSDDIDYAEGTKTPTENGKYAELLVPYGKYKITLIRTQAPKRSRRTAYRGVLDFTEKKDHKYLRTWMVPTTEAMRFIGAEATFLPNYASAAPRGFTVPLRANLIELPLCKGLSTSMTEAAALYTKGYVEVPEGLPENHYLDLMPAISGPFMNYDFRLGGGFCQYADISLAVSYTYYLHFDRLLEKWVKDYSGAFDHFEGHDVFFGLEIASRFKSINCYVRAGLQYLKGDRMYYHVAEDYESVTSTMPTEMSKFVVTVGFNIGAAGAKGQNILRVF